MRQNFAAFLSETKVCNCLVKICEFRSYWRSSAYTFHLHGTVLSKRCFTACSGNAAMIKKYRHVDIGIDEGFHQIITLNTNCMVLKSYCRSLRLQR